MYNNCNFFCLFLTAETQTKPAPWLQRRDHEVCEAALGCSSNTAQSLPCLLPCREGFCREPCWNKESGLTAQHKITTWVYFSHLRLIFGPSAKPRKAVSKMDGMLQAPRHTNSMSCTVQRKQREEGKEGKVRRDDKHTPYQDCCPDPGAAEAPPEKPWRWHRGAGSAAVGRIHAGLLSTSCLSSSCWQPISYTSPR